jgi:hypothetical protein
MRYQFRDRNELLCYGVTVLQCYTLEALEHGPVPGGTRGAKSGNSRGLARSDSRACDLGHPTTVAGGRHLAYAPPFRLLQPPGQRLFGRVQGTRHSNGVTQKAA